MIEIWPNDEAIRKVAFVSDLHLLSSRCNADDHRVAIEQAVDAADLCIWGGDLFDFRWSTKPEPESIDQAIHWLDDWCQRFPHKRFVYLDGNHDSHRSFRTRLIKFGQSRDRFACGLDCLRIGRTIWLHGDVIEGDVIEGDVIEGDVIEGKVIKRNSAPDGLARYRSSWSDRPAAGKLAGRAYDLAVAARIHRAAAMAAHRKRSTCAKLIRWLDRQGPSGKSGVDRIVFGHTHRQMISHRFGGYEFFNGGAAIRHVPFRPIILDVNQDDVAG